MTAEAEKVDFYSEDKRMEKRESVFVSTASKAVRSPRPPYVFLRVGEVVMERKGHMVGVVVSWDPELRAPPEWTDRMFSDSQVSKPRKWKIYIYQIDNIII